MSKFFAAVLLLMFAILSFAGCQKSSGGAKPDAKEIVGTWIGATEDEDGNAVTIYYTFNEDGTYQMYTTDNDSLMGTYEYNPPKLTVTVVGEEDYEMKMVFKVELSGDKMALDMIEEDGERVPDEEREVMYFERYL